VNNQAATVNFFTHRSEGSYLLPDKGFLFSEGIYAFAGLCQQEIPTGTSLMGWLCWCGAIEHKARVSFFWSTLCCFNTNI